MVASDRPVEQTNRDANKRVVVTSPKGQFHITSFIYRSRGNVPISESRRWGFQKNGLYELQIFSEVADHPVVLSNRPPAIIFQNVTKMSKFQSLLKNRL